MNSYSASKPFVVEVTGSTGGLRVVDYAAQEALRAGAELVLVAPYHHTIRRLSAVSHLPRTASAYAEAILRDAVKHVRHQHGTGLIVRTVSVEGSRLRVLHDASCGARGLVVEHELDSGPAALTSTQGNLALAGRAACPVIVVPGGRRPSAADSSVAVGIDGTPLSLEAVEFAFRTAADRDGNLIVVHSHRLPYRNAPDGDTWRERAALTVSETLAGRNERYPQVKVTRLLTTRPVVTTLACESEHLGLVVVGAHAGPLPIGDPVTRRVIAEMPCPVAVVAHHVTPAERTWRDRQATLEPLLVNSPH